MEALFSPLNLKADDRYLLNRMPEMFVIKMNIASHTLSMTEFKSQHANNYDLSTLSF